MDGCPFCAIVRGEAPASRVLQDAHCVAFLDIHPVRPGHALVVPRRHAVFLHELTPDERAFFRDADPLGYIAWAWRRARRGCRGRAARCW